MTAPGSLDTLIAPLDAARIPQTAALLAAALHDDPAYQILLPGDDPPRGQALADFFARNLAVHLPFGCTHLLLGEADELLGTVTLRPPGGVRVSLPTMLRHGLLPFARRSGVSAVQRMLRLRALYDGIEHELAAGKPYFHVHMMAVAPAHQRAGHGSMLLASLLSELVDAEDANEHGHPTLLTTHTRANVLFYQRAGFDVVHEQEVAPAPGARPYTVWSMRRARFSEQVAVRSARVGSRG